MSNDNLPKGEGMETIKTINMEKYLKHISEHANNIMDREDCSPENKQDAIEIIAAVLLLATATLPASAEGGEAHESVLSVIQDALYATGKMTTGQCETVADGIMLYLKDAGYSISPTPTPADGQKGGEDEMKRGLVELLDFIASVSDEISTKKFKPVLKTMAKKVLLLLKNL